MPEQDSHKLQQFNRLAQLCTVYGFELKPEGDVLQLHGAQTKPLPFAALAGVECWMNGFIRGVAWKQKQAAQLAATDAGPGNITPMKAES